MSDKLEPTNVWLSDLDEWLKNYDNRSMFSLFRFLTFAFSYKGSLCIFSDSGSKINRKSFRQTDKQTDRYLRQWCRTSTPTRQSAEKKKERQTSACLSAFLSLSSLIWQHPPPRSVALSLCLFVSLSLSLSPWAVPSPPFSISLPLMCFGVCYPRVLVRCCRHPKAGSWGQLKRRDAVCDIISHCYYSRLTSPHCLKLPGLLGAWWRAGQTHTFTWTYTFVRDK